MIFLSMVEYLKKNMEEHQVRTFILIGFSFVFFFIYSFIAIDNANPKFTWPDEMSNYFFISEFVDNGQFGVLEPLNQLGENMILPRSMNLYHLNLVPGTFLGFVLLFGLIGKIFGTHYILFVTPLLAALTPLIFYKLLSLIFRQKIAFVSALLMFFLPPFWYYATLTMLPNICFVFLLLLGFYLILNRKFYWQLLGYIFIGYALMIRSNEFVWIGGILIFLFFYFKQYKWQKILLAFLGFIIALLPVLYFNNQTFGGYFNFGYLRFDQQGMESLPSEFVQENANPYWNLMKMAILPFGLHLRAAWNNTYNYTLSLFWYLFIPAILGSAFLIKRYRYDKNRLAYLIVTLWVSFYLTIYYGSWVFADALTLRLNVMGLSYIRYFLPIYILVLPLAVLFISWFVNRFNNKRWKKRCVRVCFSFIFFCGFIGLSVYQVYLMGNDNLLVVKSHINEYKDLNKKIIELTEKKSIIMTERADKIIFPERKVISRWNWDNMNGVKKLLETEGIFYYLSFDDLEAVEKINVEYLDSLGIELGEIQLVDDEFILFSLKLKVQN